MNTSSKEHVAAWGPWSLVIDTDAYAGNFERAMLAYTTGVVTEFCRVGDHDLADEFAREAGKPLEDLVGWELYDPGDDGYHRTRCCIYPTPGTQEHRSVRIFLTRKPTRPEIARFKSRAEVFASRETKYRKSFKIIGYRLIRERIVTQDIKL